MPDDATRHPEGDVLARVRQEVERARRAGHAAAITRARAEKARARARALCASIERLHMREDATAPGDPTATYAQAGQLSRELTATIVEIERCRTLGASLDGARPA